MEKDYIKIYNNAYEKAEAETEKEIKEKYIEFKKNSRNSNFAGNTIVQNFYKEKEDYKIMQKQYMPLNYLYKNRLNEFDVKYQMNVIKETLLPEFNKIQHTNKYTFEQYIKELATYNARDKIYNTFSNNRGLYSLMFELNDFSEFHIKGCKGDHHSSMYEKYRKLVYDKPKKSQNLIEFNVNEGFELSIIKDNNEPPNYFGIKEAYYQKFLSLEYYNFLKKEFINDKKTNYENFKKIFTENHTNHSSKLYFFCSTILASLLLSELKKEIFYKLNMSKFAKESLITSNGEVLKGNNISKSKANKSEMDEIKVNKAIEYLKEIELSTSKR